MALQKKLDEGDLALLMITTDPILLTEFLNNTNFGDINRNNWNRGETFKLRPYQREIITDQSKNIVITGGRSIGKCIAGETKVYTTEGYKNAAALLKEPHFITYGIDPNNKLTRRRATVTKDKDKQLYTIKTKTGYKIRATDVHPLLTPDGYRLVVDLQVGDRVAVMKKLPTEHLWKDAFEWYELRLLGYLAGKDNTHADVNITPRFRAVDVELRFISRKMRTRYKKQDNIVRLLRPKGGLFKHPINYIKNEVGLHRTNPLSTHIGYVKDQTLAHQKVFLESLFAQYAHLTRNEVYLDLYSLAAAENVSEMLFYFGIENIVKHDDKTSRIILANEHAHYLFWTTFRLPGIGVGNLQKPAQDFNDINEYMRWDYITEITQDDHQNDTYAVHVYKDETFIADNIVNHNSVILENLITYYIVNSDQEFLRTAEHLLATPNQNQLTPLLDKIILRFSSSPFLKDFVNQINKSKGTLDFNAYGKNHRLYARIAGSKTENNLVGLHINKIAVDEAQLFSMGNFYQLAPTLNDWEPKSQQIFSGVHNGIRNMALYQLDQKTDNFKKYRIPSPNNPYFKYEDYIAAMKRFGGEDSDLFQQLVLAKPGSAAFSVINRERMIIVPEPFYQYRYTSTDKAKERHYKESLELPKIPKHDASILAIDTGFVDPTIIQLFISHGGKWRCFARWKIQRIDFPEQEQIIDWIASHYGVRRIALDIGAGGGGSGIMQSLLTRPEFAGKGYTSRILPVNFSDVVNIGRATEDEIINITVKSFAGNEIAQIIEGGMLTFSELDTEGISQIERIAKQRTPSGADKFFIMSDRGTGASTDDHIFASYVCFIMALQAGQAEPVKKLARSSITNTKI